MNGVGTAGCTRPGVLREEPARLRPRLDPPPHDRAQVRPEHLPARQRPRDPHLDGAAGRPRAARAAVAVRPHGRAQEPGPDRARPRPRPGRRARRVRRGRAVGEDDPRGDGARPDAGDQRQQGHPPVCRARRQADQRRGLRGRPRARARPRGRPPRPRRQRHEEDPARGQGARRLEPEQRQQDHDHAVLAARPGAPDGRGAAHLARTREQGSRPARLPRGARAGEARGDPLADLTAGHLASLEPTPERMATFDRADGPDRLAKYRSMRDQKKTPEPVPDAAPKPVGRRCADLRHPGAPRPAPALGLPARARRRARELGAAPRGADRPEAEPPRRADRGPPARVRLVRGHDPGGRVRRRAR